MDRTHSPINSILEQAAYIVRRKKETAGTLEPTESYKRRQTKKLIDLANANNLWISLSNKCRSKFLKGNILHMVSDIQELLQVLVNDQIF